MMASSSADAEEPRPRTLQVTFFPPLHNQRRIWILDILRRENCDSVLDVGCGEGGLLGTLCNPALYLPPLPPEDPDAPPTNLKDLYPEELANLHCSRIAGVDVSAPDLAFAAQSAEPLPDDPYVGVRWEPLEVKIWRGGLEAFNAEFVGVECIIATEVIEHLPEEIEADFAPVLLGVYHPRLLLITTPSYTFNARFAPPGLDDGMGYRDPTGRTDRVFRHPDHKFEWTVEEFTRWCSAAAAEWGYDVAVSSVGRAMEDDEWGRDDELGGASQVAEFKRRDDEASVGAREERNKAVLEKAAAREAHELLVVHQHPPHPRARHPAPQLEIADAVGSQMLAYRKTLMTVEELWLIRDIAILCGGWLEVLIDAVKRDERLELRGTDEKSRCNWRVELMSELPAMEDSWQPQSVGEVSADPFDDWAEESPDMTEIQEEEEEEEEEEGGQEEDVQEEREPDFIDKEDARNEGVELEDIPTWDDGDEENPWRKLNTAAAWTVEHDAEEKEKDSPT